MSGYNISNNPPNFRDRAIYNPIAPNQTLDSLIINENLQAPIITDLQNNAGVNPPLFSTDFTKNVINFMTGAANLIYNPSNLTASKGIAVLAGNAFTNEDKFAAAGYANSSNGSFDPDSSIFQFTSCSKIITALGYAKMLEEGLIFPTDPVFNYISTFTGTYTYPNQIFATTGQASAAGYTGNLRDGFQYTQWYGGAIGGNPITGAFNNINPSAPNTWLFTSATGNLGDFTLADMFGLRFPLLVPVYNQTAITCITTAENPLYFAGCSTGSDSLKRDALTENFNYYGLLRGWETSGFAGFPNPYPSDITNTFIFKNRWYQASFGLTYPARNDILNIIDFVKQGYFLLSSARDQLVAGVLPELPYLSQKKTAYDSGYQILGLALDNACRAKLNGLPFHEYIRTKIFAPLEINNMWFLGIDSTSNITNYASRKVEFTFGRQLTYPEVLQTPNQTVNFPGGIATGAASASWAINLGSNFRNTSLATVNANYTQFLAPGVPTPWAGAPSYAGDGLQLTGRKVWSSQYPADSFSLIPNAFTATTFVSINSSGQFYVFNPTGTTVPAGNPNIDCIYASIPCLGTFRDLSKILKLIINQGKYRKANGTWVQVLSPQSINFLTIPKISALQNVGLADGPAPLGYTLRFQPDVDSFSSSWCGGFGRTNRDITDSGIFPLTDNTCSWIGIAGLLYFFDLKTGYYTIMGTQDWLLDGQNVFNTNGLVNKYNPQRIFATTLRL